MQGLSSWPAKGEFRVVHNSDFCKFHSKTFGCLLVSRNLRILRSGSCIVNSKFDLGFEILSGFCKPKFSRFSKRKRSSFGSWFVLAWAIEQQEVDNEVLMKESSSEHNDIEENGERNVDCEKEVEGEKSERIDVKALASSLRLAKTEDDVEEVLRDVGELPLQVYCSMIRGFGRDKKMACAMALFKWLKRKKIETNGRISPNLFIYNSLLGAVKQSQQFEKMEYLLVDMAREGVVPNVVTYNAIMAIYAEQGRISEVLNVLEEIPKKGMTPSPVSYSTAVLAYRKMEDGNGALKFVTGLKEKYVKGEIGKNEKEDWDSEFIKLDNFTKRVCYQVMRNWLVKKYDLSTKVLQLVMEMDKAGLSLDREEEERLIWACTRPEHYIVAKELYNRIRERHSDISLSVCNHVIWLMGKAKKWWAALEIYEDLLDKGPKPNNLSYELIVSHFNILLTAARKRGIWRWGVRLLNKMEEKGLKPGSREWNAVLVACSKAAETSAAVEIFRRMVEQGEKPTILSYGALLSALEKGKLYDEARKVWDHMIKVGVEPNLYAYTTMASVFTGQGKFKMVDAILNDMVSSGIEPTIVTYNAIITGCAQNGMSSAAYEWFHRLKVRKIAPNEVTYEILIEALAKEGKPMLAYQLYMRARNEDLALSLKAYDAVIQSSQVYGASIDIDSLGPRPPDKKKIVKVHESLTEFCKLADVPRRSKPFDRKEIYTSE